MALNDQIIKFKANRLKLILATLDIHDIKAMSRTSDHQFFDTSGPQPKADLNFVDFSVLLAQIQ